MADNGGLQDVVFLLTFMGCDGDDPEADALRVSPLSAGLLPVSSSDGWPSGLGQSLLRLRPILPRLSSLWGSLLFLLKLIGLGGGDRQCVDDRRNQFFLFLAARDEGVRVCGYEVPCRSVFALPVHRLFAIVLRYLFGH